MIAASRIDSGSATSSHYLLQYEFIQYGVFAKGIAIKSDLMNVVGDDVNILIVFKKSRTVNIAASADVNASEDLVSRSQAQSGQRNIGLFGGLQSVGVRNVVGLSQLHQVHRVVVLDVRMSDKR